MPCRPPSVVIGRRLRRQLLRSWTWLDVGSEAADLLKQTDRQATGRQEFAAHHHRKRPRGPTALEDESAGTTTALAQNVQQDP